MRESNIHLKKNMEIRFTCNLGFMTHFNELRYFCRKINLKTVHVQNHAFMRLLSWLRRKSWIRTMLKDIVDIIFVILRIL